MRDAKPVSTPLDTHFKLAKKMCPKTWEKIDYMYKLPYSSAVGSLMYVMVCTRPYVVRKYMNNPGKENW